MTSFEHVTPEKLIGEVFQCIWVGGAFLVQESTEICNEHRLKRKTIVLLHSTLEVRVVDGVEVFVNLATKSLRGLYAVVFQFWFEKNESEYFDMRECIEAV